MPLELEAAKVLTSKGFTVSSNYKYDKGNPEFVRDMSVDLHARTYSPFSESNSVSDPGEATAKLELLVECMHRHSDIAWFFLPDPNSADTSPVILGNTIRMVDKFSSYVIESDAAVAFDASMPICQKGLEIDTARGDADESVFRQGLSQLQYAIPYLLTENVLFYIEEEPVKNIPFLFCPIFLTNSDLFVLGGDVTSEDIEASSHIRDIADETPYLMMYLDYSKDFENRCVSETARMANIQKSEKAMIIERKRAGYYGSEFNLPFTIIESLITANRCYLDVFFTQFIICNSSHFPMLVDVIKDTVKTALETRTLIN